MKTLAEQTQCTVIGFCGWKYNQQVDSKLCGKKRKLKDRLYKLIMRLKQGNKVNGERTQESEIDGEMMQVALVIQRMWEQRR